MHNDQRIRGIPRRLIFAMGFLSLTISLSASEPGKIEGRITKFDIATRDDLLFSRLVGPVMAGDTAEWSKRLLGGMPAQVGDWVNQFTDARTLASIVIEAFPVEGQDALKPIDTLVTECARTLDVDKPEVHVRNSPLTRAYTVKAGGRHHLVLTSGLLNLFEGKPLELKFVVGRELGHIKCEHPELKRKSYAVLSTIQAIDVALVPDRCQQMLPLLALGRLLSWCRESEFSADRAGLLCCGEPKPAYEAIMRLQHGLRADSIWLNPEAKDFDPQAIISSFRQWQYEPFIRFILHLKKQPLEHPYYQERLAMLKAWVDSGTHRKILERDAGSSEDQLIEILNIQAFELAEEGQTADPYLIVLDGDRQVLRTRYAAAVREAEWSGFRSADAGVEQPRSFRNGQPLFFEIWDRNYVQDAFIGGFVIYPDGRDAKVAGAGESLAQYTGKILWDWNEPQTISRPGYARVLVRFSHRQTETPLAAKKEPGQ